jgi:hypothetical protein
VLSFAGKKGIVGVGAADDRLWYVPPAEPGETTARLIGTRLVPAILDATPDRPVQLTMTSQGLVR